MKPSHLTTPRSMEECNFALNADPIEHFEKSRYDWQDKVVIAGSAISALALIVILWAS